MTLEIPKDLQRNPHFARYYRTWEKNALSIVFIPLSQICREQGFLDLAREICERGLSRHPASVSGRLMLARIHLDQDKLDLARSLVEKVLEEYPAQQEAASLCDKIARAQGRPVNEAKKESKSQAAATTSPAVKEDVHKDEESPDSSESEDATEVTTVSSTVSIWENPTMAKIYADQGETRIARQILDKILTRDPKNARAAELKRTLTA